MEGANGRGRGVDRSECRFSPGAGVEVTQGLPEFVDMDFTDDCVG